MLKTRIFFFVSILSSIILFSCNAKNILITEGTLIVLNKDAAKATFVSLETGEIVATVPTGIGPHEIAVSQNGEIAVVGDYGYKEPGSSLTIINVKEKKVINKIELGEYKRPHGMMFLPDGKRIVVTSEVAKAVIVVNIDESQIEKALKTDQIASHQLALAPDGKVVYVANILSGTISAIDIETGETLKLIETGNGSEGIDASPDGREVWVANQNDNTIRIINTESLEETEKFECGQYPIRIKFTPDGKYALISNAMSGDISVIDATTRKEVKRISMGMPPEGKETDLPDEFKNSAVPIGILILPDGKFAFVSNNNSENIAVINMESLELVNTLNGGETPDGTGYSQLNLR